MIQMIKTNTKNSEKNKRDMLNIRFPNISLADISVGQQ